MIDFVKLRSVMYYLFWKYYKNSNINSKDLNKLRDFAGGTEQLKEALAKLREDGIINKDFHIDNILSTEGDVLTLKKDLDIENILTKNAVETYYSIYMKNWLQTEAMKRYVEKLNSSSIPNSNIKIQEKDNSEELTYKQKDDNVEPKQDKIKKEILLKQAYTKVINSLNNSDNTKKQNKKGIEKTKKEGVIKFIGILGENCGEIINSSGGDEKRIQEKGFKVKNGIKVLRGFAKSSDLASYSKKDENYQRSSNEEHLKSIEHFIENIRPSAKYLPEVTLVARGYENLERIKLSGKLSDTQQGELDNLEYYELTVFEDDLLYRI